MKKVIGIVSVMTLGLFSCSSLDSGDAAKLASFSADAAVTGNQIYFVGKEIVEQVKVKNLDSLYKLSVQLVPLVVREGQDKDSIAFYANKIKNSQ